MVHPWSHEQQKQKNTNPLHSMKCCCWLVAFFSIEIPIMVFPLRGRFYTEITHCQISPRQPGYSFPCCFFSSRQSWKVENWVLKKLAIFHWTMILGERLHCWKLTDGILKIIHFPWNLEEFWCLAVRFRGCMLGICLVVWHMISPFLPTTFFEVWPYLVGGHMQTWKMGIMSPMFGTKNTTQNCDTTIWRIWLR